MDAFLSFIGLWPLNWAPRNWALCWGQRIDISENTALFSLINSYFGGDSRTYFQLPDFRGRVPVGYGQGIGLSAYQLGLKGGYEQVKLVQSQLPAHKHAAALSAISVKFKASAEMGTESTPGENNATTLGGTKSGRSVGDKLYNTAAPTVELDGISANGGTIAVQDTGQNLDHENRQPFLAVNYIICTEGIYPPRP